MRPVLIISGNDINGTDAIEDFIGVAITTKLRNTSYSVEIQSGDYISGNMPEASEILCSKIACLQKDLVQKKLCTLTDNKFNSAMKIILEALGQVP